MGNIRWFEELTAADAAEVGARAVAAGELARALGSHGVRAPGGFAVIGPLADEAAVRAAYHAGPLADEAAVRAAYHALSERSGIAEVDVELHAGPGAAASSLHVRGEERLLAAVRACLDGASVVSVQKLVRADLASSGVISTIDAASGHDGVLALTSRFGLAQGEAEPDRFLVHKATLRKGHASLVAKSIARKSSRLVYAAGEAGAVEVESVPSEEQCRASLSDAEALQLARAALQLEDHEAKRSGQRVPLDLEWGKDGLRGELYILQVKPGAARQHAAAPPAAQAQRPRTQLMLNIDHPQQALALAQLPSDGVGLLRMEYLFANSLRIHPLAVTRFAELPHELMVEVDRATSGSPDKRGYFVDKLAQGIGLVAAAFHPRPVLLRLSDFTANEYGALIGGAHFEVHEANPLLGWRGASRYAHSEYKDGFLLEVAAIRRVREQFGLTNLKLMVPFCRTPEEGRRVLELLAEAGLVSGRDGLEIRVLAELPANVLMADELAQLFDGLCIGSGELAQLLLGADAGNPLVANLSDERSPAVREACALIVQAAHRCNKKVGLCGRAPSDLPDFASFLVEQGIDSISVEPEALGRTAERALAAEQLGPKRRSADRGAGRILRLERRRGLDRRDLADESRRAVGNAPTSLVPERPVSLLALAEAAAASASAPAAAGAPADAMGFLIDDDPRATD